ncbi:MAG: DUF721 domain-containing protein [Bacteroidales bacterium]|jgi:hypothetical protein|nr:DUF721 domain-containing protein [Bacteroidales bacterium]
MIDNGKNPNIRVSLYKEKELKDVLKDVISLYHININLDQDEIISLWQDITGEIVQKLTKTIYVNNNCLYVEVSSSALKHELLLIRTSILKQIKEKLPESKLKNIYIK